MAVTRTGASKRRGRPALPSEQVKRAHFTTRLRNGLKKSLEAEAANAGRSLSEEIEFRLERSFADQDALNDAFGGAHNLAVMRVAGTAIAAIERLRGSTWLQDREVFQQAQSLVMTIFAAYGAEIHDDHLSRFRGKESDLKEIVQALSTETDVGVDAPLLLVAKAIQDSLVSIGPKKNTRGQDPSRPGPRDWDLGD